MRTTLTTAFLLAALALAAAGAAAAPVPAGNQAGTPTQAAVQTKKAGAHTSAPCNVSIPVIGGLVSTVTNAACGLGGDVASGVGDVAGAVGSSVLDAVASWLISAATAITGFVAKQMTATTTPQLKSAWYAAQFAPMADLGAGLALMVAIVALGSAALRRSPDALAQTLTATVRAGFGTGLIVALTAIGLALADQISTDVIGSSPNAFWNTVASAWGHTSFGGFGSSALAAVVAIVEVFAALFVWLELIVRNAAIYIAVLFFPVALAASIWPPLAGWTGRLGRLLLLFVILKPITLIVLSLAGNAAAAGLSLDSGGVSGSVGTILAAVVIFALAAFAPWALMYLLAADAESAWTAGAVRSGAGQAVAGQSRRSVRTGGGLASLGAGRRSASGGGASGGGGASAGGGGSAGGGDPRPGSPAMPSPNGTASHGSNGAGSSSAVGGGSVAAAAGMHAHGSDSDPASPTQSAGSAQAGGGDHADRLSPVGAASGSGAPTRAGGARSDKETGARAGTPPGRSAAAERRPAGRAAPSRTNPAMPSPVRKPPPPPRSGK
jgi:type IV secretion system protein TrbL